MDADRPTDLDLWPPYNWCDSRCARCPLQDSCKAAVLRPETADCDILDEDAGALCSLREGQVQSSPAARWALRLCTLGWRYVRVARDLARAVRSSETALLVSNASLAFAKLSRLAAHLDLLPGECPEDLNLNRLLLEHIESEADRVLAARSAAAPPWPAELVAAWSEARREVAAEVERIFGPTSDDARRFLSALRASGRAPSPFCIRATPSERA